MEVVNCILCDSRESDSLFVLTDLWLERENVQASFVCCKGCGLIYQNPRPNFSEMNQHYPKTYEVFSKGTENKKSFLFDYGMEKRSKLITEEITGGKLLDIGCANGTFLLWMKQKKGFEVFGVEISEHASKYARDLGLTVITGTLNDAKFQNNYFDIITMWDVLEHFHNPLDTLIEANRILKPGGIVVIRVPNHHSIDSRLFGRYWAGYDAPRHLYVFNNKTITSILSKSKFKIERKTSQIGGYLNFVKSIRFYLNDKKVSKRVTSIFENIFSSIFVRILMAPFFWVKDLNLRGSEMVVIARKKENSDLVMEK
jgi:2-polyprenyl-3-methyl-5-hydroxy-6-metoxy-1,4-benzoquinol methylase